MSLPTPAQSAAWRPWPWPPSMTARRRRAGRGAGAGLPRPTPEPASVTFNQHIAPLLHEHCAQCHRPGGAGPFNLLTFADAARRAAQIAAVTGSGFMPPWKADGRPGEFVAQPRLTADEIATLGRWAKAPTEGPGQAPPPPRWPDGWYLGEPDLVVTLPDGYTLPGEPSDVFRIFAVPLPVTGPRYVRGIEFRPGNARVVHHANIRIDRTRRLPPARRGRSVARLRRPAGPIGGVPRRPLPGLDPGADRPAGRRRSGLASRPRHRPGGAAAHAAERQAGSGAAVHRLLLQRHPAHPHADHPAARLAGHRHRRRRRPLRRRGSLHAAGGRDAPGRAAARALPGRRRHRHGDVARRDGAHAHPHRRVGLPLAARLPLHRADPPAARHHGGDALPLRQLAAEPAQPAGAAGARPLGPAVVRRDGRPVVPAGHRQRRRPRPAARRSAGQDDRRGPHRPRHHAGLGARRHRAARRCRRAGAAARASGRRRQPLPGHRRAPAIVAGRPLQPGHRAHLRRPLRRRHRQLRAGVAARAPLRQGAQQPGRHADGDGPARRGGGALRGGGRRRSVDAGVAQQPRRGAVAARRLRARRARVARGAAPASRATPRPTSTSATSPSGPATCRRPPVISGGPPSSSPTGCWRSPPPRGCCPRRPVPTCGRRPTRWSWRNARPDSRGARTPVRSTCWPWRWPRPAASTTRCAPPARPSARRRRRSPTRSRARLRLFERGEPFVDRE